MAIYKFQDLLNKHNVTADEVTTFGSPQSIQNSLNSLQKPKEENSGFIDRFKTTLGEEQQKISDIKSSDASTPTKIAQQAAVVTGLPLKAGYEALPTPVRGALSWLGGQIGKGFEALTNEVADTKLFKELGEYEAQGLLTKENAPEYFQTKDILAGAGAAGETAGNLLFEKQIVQGGIGLGEKGVNLAKEGSEFVKQATNKTSQKLGTIRDTAPAEIMNRVARLKPTDATKFKNMTGKTQGEYLRDTGNFGAPDKIITKEAVKFANSKARVDAELAKLPGVYQDGSVLDALKGLYDKAVKTSGDSVKSPYLKQVETWATKFKNGGLTMEEINAVKRLFEKEVKLGYNKLTNADKVQQATNIDSALRKWQIRQAKTLGFKNIAEMNKQTQASKFLIDKLGDQVVGQNGLNSINLTDWIVLGGGDPVSVSGFLTKKFFSSKGVQAKLAETLNRKAIQPNVTPDIGMSETIQLPAPKPGSPKSSINVPINQPSSKAIAQGTEIVPRTTRSTPTKQPVLKIESQKALPKTISETTNKIKGTTQSLDDTVSNSISSAEQAISELPKSELAKLGGIDKLMQQTVKDISMQLESYGYKSAAQKLNKIDLSAVRSLDSLETKIYDTIYNTATKNIPKVTSKINIKNPKAIPQATKAEMAEVIDYVRLKKPYSQTMEEMLGKLAEKYGITSKSPTSVANKLEDLIKKTK